MFKDNLNKGKKNLSPKYGDRFFNKSFNLGNVNYGFDDGYPGF